MVIAYYLWLLEVARSEREFQELMGKRCGVDRVRIAAT
jgi:hypothetical protein